MPIQSKYGFAIWDDLILIDCNCFVEISELIYSVSFISSYVKRFIYINYDKVTIMNCHNLLQWHLNEEELKDNKQYFFAKLYSTEWIRRWTAFILS